MGRSKVIKGKRSNNEGSTIQLPNGKWRCMLSLGFKDDGTRNRVSKVFDTEAQANAWKIKQLATVQEYGNDSIKEDNDLFIVKYHKWLLNVKQAEVYSMSFKVMMDYYNKHIKPNLMKFKQRDLTHDVFQTFFTRLEQQGVGYETRRKLKCQLRQYYEREFANSPMRNPLDNIKLATKKKMKIINPDEIIFKEDYKAVPKEVRIKFLEALNHEQQSRFLKPMCYLMYFSGNRVGETLAYQWKDFNFDRRYFLVYKAVTIDYEFDENGNKVGKAQTVIKSPKTSEGIRPLPLLDILYEVLHEWYDYRKAQEKVTGLSFTAPDDYLFATEKGELRSRWGANTVFTRFLKRHGLYKQGIHFHALRQTFSNSLFAGDVEDKLITDLLGHTKIDTSRKHYNSLQKFDSVQKAARMFNDRYRPKNPEYCAGADVTFAPEGYITEQDSWFTGGDIGGNIQTAETVKLLPPPNEPKRPITELFDELASYPEFQELMTKMAQRQKGAKDMEAE